MQLRQCLKTTHRQGGIRLTSHAHDPQRCYCNGQPEPFRTLWVQHLGLMPLPSPALGIFKAAFYPTAHPIPCGCRLLRCQIRHDEPHLCVPLIPLRKQGTTQSALLLAEAVDFATPTTALG